MLDFVPLWQEWARAKLGTEHEFILFPDYFFSCYYDLIEYEISINTLTLGSGSHKLPLGLLGSDNISSHNYRTLDLIFTNRTSFSPES